LERGGYLIRLQPGEALDTFEGLLRADKSYRSVHRRRFLFHDQEIPPRQERREVAAEHPYNVVALGAASERLIETLSRTRLWFDADTFEANMQRLDADAQKIRQQLRDQYQSMRTSPPGDPRHIAGSRTE